MDAIESLLQGRGNVVGEVVWCKLQSKRNAVTRFGAKRGWDDGEPSTEAAKES